MKNMVTTVNLPLIREKVMPDQGPGPQENEIERAKGDVKKNRVLIEMIGIGVVTEFQIEEIEAVKTEVGKIGIETGIGTVTIDLIGWKVAEGLIGGGTDEMIVMIEVETGIMSRKIDGLIGIGERGMKIGKIVIDILLRRKIEKGPHLMTKNRSPLITWTKTHSKN